MRKLLEKLAFILMKNKQVIKTNLLTENFSTVCFFSNTAIGDTLFNTPVFRAFKQNYPHVKSICLLNPKNYQLFKNNPYIDEIVLYTGRWKNFFTALKILKNKKIDVVFISHSNEPQATPLAVLCGAKYIFKLQNAKNKFNAFHSNDIDKNEISHYVVKHRLKILEFIGIKDTNTRMELFLKDEDYVQVDKIFKKENGIKYIGFQMGASTVSRQWFLEKWVELANLLLKKKNIKIILTGSKNDKIMCDKFVKNINFNANILNFAGIFSIRSAAALIGKLDLFITPDTGPLHIAAALKTPTITLFAVASPLSSNPNFDTNLHKFIKKDQTCTPCLDKRCKYQKCMLQITPLEVYNLCKKFL